MVNANLLFGSLVTLGSLVALLFVLRRFGTSRRGLGLLALVVFWLAWGLRSLDGTAVTYPGPIVLGLTVVGGIALIVGLGLLIPELRTGRTAS